MGTGELATIAASAATNATMLPDPHLFLALADHAPGAPQSQPLAGSPGVGVRCLDVTGRWVADGSTHAPLLAWPEDRTAEAEAAAGRASRARGCTVRVISLAKLSGHEGREVRMFTDACEPVLARPSGQSAATARRLRTEADKLEAFALIVRAASAAADHDAFSEVGRAAAKALRTRFGGGSITSCFAWLAGRAGREALDSVRAGDVALGGSLSLEDLAGIVELAREAETLREKL